MPLPLFATSSATRRGAAAKMRGHVAVCPFFQPPHPETFFLFGKSLAAANRHVQVTVFTPVFYGMYLYSYWDPEEDHNLAFYPVGEWPSSSSTPASPDAQLRVYLEEIGGNLRSSMARAEEEFGLKITYLMADAFLADVCRGIADEKAVRWLAIWTSSATSIAAYMHGDEIRRRSGVSLPVLPGGGPAPIIPVVPEVPIIPVIPGGPEPVLPIPVIPGGPETVLPIPVGPPGPTPAPPAPVDTPVDMFLPGFPPGVLLLDLPHGSITAPENLEAFPFAKMFHGMVRSLPTADAVIVNSFNNLESAVASALLGPNFTLSRIMVPPTVPFPPTVALDDREGIFPWLDSRPAGSVVYINLLGSTEDSLPLESEFHALALALEATGVPFLWHVAPTWPRVNLPEGFVERTNESGQGKVVTGAWSPVRLLKMETEVVGHEAVGAQMRPSAWWSVEVSVTAGKPIICRAATMWFDQALNAALVERVWEIGVVMEGWPLTKSSAEKALRRVMLGEEGRRLKEKAVAVRKLAEEDARGSSAKTLSKIMALATK